LLGYDHDAFWDQTPRTLQVTWEAFNDRRAMQHNDRAWLAWHTAGLHRTKKLPQLQALFVKKETPQTLESQLEGLKNWVQATGGKVIYKQ